MLVDVIFLQLVNDFNLLLSVFNLLEEFGPIGYELNIIDEVNRVFDILGHLTDISRDEKIGLAIYDDRSNEVVKFGDMSESNLLNSTLIVFF